MGKAWALDDRDQLHKDANKALDENLMPGEGVRVIIRGSYDSALIATDRRVFVFKKGIFSGAAMAKKLSSWDYRNITGIQIETGMVSGTVALQAAGAVAVDASFWGGDSNSAMKAANAIALVRDHFDQAKLGVAGIRQLIAANQAGPTSVTAAPDIPDQLRKLAELRDAGIVTAAEFDAKKAELLSRL